MNSYRQIFRTSAIMGSVSVVSIVISIIRVKVIAVLLGPAGIGLMGLYNNIMSVATTLAGCGMGSSGVRQIAASAGEQEVLGIARRALWLSNLMLGLIGMSLLWLLRDSVSIWVFDDTAHAGQVGWLGLGVLLSLIAGSQAALLQGLRRIGDLARVNIISAFIGAVVGLLAIYLLREEGIIWFVLSAPAISVLVAWYYAQRLPPPRSGYEWQAILQQWLTMLKLGIPLMAAALLTLVTQLAVRSIVVRELGLDASGYFQAAWAISMSYVVIVLGAMGTDYLPRLTEVIHDHKRAGKLVNEQAEMALLISAPILLAMVTLAPLVINLLYTESFHPAVEILRWQVLGDILKVSGWPMGFIVVAQGRGGLFIITQLTWNLVYLGVIVLGINEYGLIVTGVGFWIAYIIGYSVVNIVAMRLIGFKLDRRNGLFTLILSLAGGLVLFLSSQSSWVGPTVGLLLTSVVSVYSFRRLDSLIDLRGWLQQKFGRNHE